MKREKAAIIGAGPAGLTAAYELLARTQIHPIVLEMTPHLGGLSRTAQYRGNRIDIGGHRFFSKSDRVMQWWLSQMPLEAGGGGAVELLGHLTLESIAGEAPDPETADNVMLLRQRRSRIYYQRKFFDYPLSLSLDTVPQARAAEAVADRPELPSQRGSPHAAGGQPRRVLHQPFRPGTLPHVLPVLHGESLGRALRKSTPSGVPSGSRGFP